MPNIFLEARFTSSCANASWIKGGQFCWASVRLLLCVISTFMRDRSRDICSTVPPTAIPDASATCSKGQLPSAAEASSKTARAMHSHIIFLIARNALHPSVSDVPNPFSGKTAPGFCHAPNTLAA